MRYHIAVNGEKLEDGERVKHVVSTVSAEERVKEEVVR